MLWSRFGNLQNSWWWYWWCWWWGWGIDEKLSRRLLLRISESFRLQKSVWRNVFWFVKAYIFWKFIQCTILCDKKTTAKKKFARQNKRSKKCTAFSFASSSSVLFLIHDSYMSWRIWLVSLKLNFIWDFAFSIPFRFY